jgi:hypothetical protein
MGEPTTRDVLVKLAGSVAGSPNRKEQHCSTSDCRPWFRTTLWRYGSAYVTRMCEERESSEPASGCRSTMACTHISFRRRGEGASRSADCEIESELRRAGTAGLSLPRKWSARAPDVCSVACSAIFLAARCAPWRAGCLSRRERAGDRKSDAGLRGFGLSRRRNPSSRAAARPFSLPEKGLAPWRARPFKQEVCMSYGGQSRADALDPWAAAPHKDRGRPVMRESRFPQVSAGWPEHRVGRRSGANGNKQTRVALCGERAPLAQPCTTRF